MILVYRGISWRHQLLHIFCKNPTVRIVCSALTDSLSRNCVIMILYVNFLPFCRTWLSCCWHLCSSFNVCWWPAADLIYTCSDLLRMLRTIFSKPTVSNTVTFNTAVFFWYRYTVHPYFFTEAFNTTEHRDLHWELFVHINLHFRVPGSSILTFVTAVLALLMCDTTISLLLNRQKYALCTVKDDIVAENWAKNLSGNNKFSCKNGQS